MGIPADQVRKGRREKRRVEGRREADREEGREGRAVCGGKWKGRKWRTLLH